MKCIALDVGNVLVEFKIDNLLSDLYRSAGISYNEGFEFLERNQALHDLGLTKIRNELKHTFNIKDEDKIDEIMGHWNKSLMPNSTVISWVEKLMYSGVKVAILSNMGSEHRSVIGKYLGDKIYNNSELFFSVDVGARKPTFIYYNTFLSLHPEWKGCVYLDDNAENINVGNKFGFQAIKFDITNFKDKIAIEEELVKIEKKIF